MSKRRRSASISRLPVPSSRSRPVPPALDRPGLRRAVRAHVRRRLGPVAWSWTEEGGEWVRLEILGVAPSRKRPFWTLVTAGMASRPMDLPPVAGGGKAWSELVLHLPADWPMEQVDRADSPHHWPLRELLALGRYPHRHRTWLGWGHTIADGPDPGPLFPGTELCCWLLVHPLFLPRTFGHLDHGSVHLHFHLLMGLHRDEMDFKLDAGADLLLGALLDGGVGPALDPRRPSVLGGRTGRGG